jgi:ATP-binding cassette subfamily B multidrug efflux pump
MSANRKSPLDSAADDDILGRAFDRRLMLRLLSYSRPYKLLLTGAVILIVATSALGVYGPIIVKKAIDGPLAKALFGAPDGATFTDDPWSELLDYGTIFFGITTLLVVVRFLSGFAMAVIGQNVMYDLRTELFQHLGHLPLRFYDRNPVGRLVTRISSDIESLNDWFASGFITLIADVMVLVGIAVVLLYYDLTLALITLGVLPPLLLATFVFRNKVRRYYREQRGHLAHLGAFTQEAVQGMSIIQLFHREQRSSERYGSINAALKTAFRRSVAAYSVYFPVVETLGKLTLIVILWQADRAFRAGTLTLGTFFLFWVFLERFFQPIRDMAERYNVLQAAMASAERLFAILDKKTTLLTLPLPERAATAVAQPKASEPLRHVEFRNVWFAYKEDEFVLKNVSFKVEAGKTAAIVGATGAGKSTIIQLLSRFYDPQEGEILLNGTDLRHYDKHDVRRRMGLVLQDVFLFSRSIRENITLGNVDIDDGRVREAARVANASGFIERLEHGYDQVLSERGGSLSVGERQLLVFARALAHNPEILILDEATASIDTETEILIQDALSKLVAGRTSIVIAHRLSTIRQVDQIFVMHKGEIREQGTHSELLVLGGIYSRLHALQYRQ